MKSLVLSAVATLSLAAVLHAAPPSLDLKSSHASAGQSRSMSDADRTLVSAAGSLGQVSVTMATHGEAKLYDPGAGPGGTRGGDARKLFKKCAPSVVALISPDGKSLGSGTFVDADGTILTNWHVVEGQTEMMVLCYSPEFSGWNDIAPNDLQRSPVIATDNKRDLALVRMSGAGKHAVATLGSAEGLEVAQDVFAIGHPLEQLWTFTYGVISAIRPKYDWSYGEGTAFRAEIIQTQTPINPGNSGGPLFDDNGRLIGMNSFTSGQGEGLNYAIHISELKEFIDNGKAGKYPVEASQPTPNAAPASASGTTGASGGSPAEGGTPVDANQDGVTDRWCYDSNGNGVFDIYMIDENQDGTVDYVASDVDENQQAELIMYDDDHNGTYEHWYMDTNGDTKYDTEAWDDNGDYKMDRSSPYAG